MEFIVKNKEWIFSGIGVAAIPFIINMFVRRKKKENKVIMNQKNGANSVNNQSSDKIEIKGDIKINVK